MTIDLIFPLVAGAVAVVLLGVWKTGRAVAVAALRHPLRKNVIYMDKDGTPHISAASPSPNGYKATEAEAVRGHGETLNSDEERGYTVAKSR